MDSKKRTGGYGTCGHRAALFLPAAATAFYRFDSTINPGGVWSGDGVLFAEINTNGYTCEDVTITVKYYPSNALGWYIDFAGRIGEGGGDNSGNNGGGGGIFIFAEISAGISYRIK